MYQLSFLGFCIASFLLEMLYIYMHPLSFFSGSVHVTVLTFWGFCVTAFLFGEFSLSIYVMYTFMCHLPLSVWCFLLLPVSIRER